MLLNGSYIGGGIAKKSPGGYYFMRPHIDRNPSRQITAAHTVAPRANRHGVNFVHVARQYVLATTSSSRGRSDEAPRSER